MVFVFAMVWASLFQGPHVGVASDMNEPPVNHFLADSPWPMSHRNPYCQASSPFPGPKSVTLQTTDGFTAGSTGLITLAISGSYPDGRRVVWGSSSTTVFKAFPPDGDSQTQMVYSDKIRKDDISITSPVMPNEILSGAYTLVDRDHVFFVPRFTRLYAYQDAVEGDLESEIDVRSFFEIPQDLLRSDEEKIVGLSLLYDGMIAFVTSHGLVGVVDRSFGSSHYLALGEDEEVSNSIACDEDGGIYVVTSQYMHRVQWTGSELTLDEGARAWTANYETGDSYDGVRLGAGSGSTPTLMGTGNQDKFVCITDGQDLMHIVLLWRDRIPDDWQTLPETNERRIAAQIPVTFGDPDAVQSLSEQSVCIRGYGALVVNNEVARTFDMGVVNMLFSGIDSNAPYGAEKFQWDPATRSLSTAWVNPDISIPNGIPCMSSATNLAYGVGQNRWGAWTFEALDWSTGERVFSYKYGTTTIYNSAYAATEIGLNGSLYTGTALGMACMNPPGF